MHICTIIAKNYVPFARVLARSFAEQHPDGRCSVLVVDSFEGHLDPGSEPFEILTPEDIDCPQFASMAVIYDVLELCTAVKPWLLKHLLAESGPEGVVYLDPDIRIYSPLSDLEPLTRAHGVVVTPHVLTPVPRDGRRPNEHDLMIAGTYNLGFLSIGPGPQSEQLLEWWSERLRYDCLVDPAQGYFVDQRWFDLLPSIVESFHVLRDPGYNVAYWNLHGAPLEHSPDGLLAGDRPLRFFHFSGFDPDAPMVLSRHQTRVDVQSDAVLSELCLGYASELREADYEEARRWTFDFAALPDGTELSSGLRRLLRAAELNGAEPLESFTPAGLSSYYDSLNEPLTPDGPAEVTRAMNGVYFERPDLRRAFPDFAGEHSGEFLRWMREEGREQLSLPEILLEPADRVALNGSEPHAPAPASAHAPRAERAAGRPDSDEELDSGADPWGVNVAGYLRSELGVGEAARMAISALDAAGVPVLPVHGSFVPRSRQAHDYSHVDTAAAGFPVNLICVNADMLPSFAEQAGPEFFEDRYTIGMWFWEVETFPRRWHDSFDHLDEVWVASQHIADALSPVSPVPVVKTRLPFSLPDFPRLSRAALGLPDGFVFLNMFDFDSGFARKNPLGAVRAFRAAFPEPGEASLVLKCINSEHHPERFAALVAEVAEHPDIHILDRYVSVAEKNAMIASCDCFVSLHRAEGLGIGPAEAMWLGKPVIATGYSGTLDFMTAENSFLVDHHMVEIGQGNAPYPATGLWAQPDEAHATALMRTVLDDPATRAQRAQRGASDIRRTHSPAAAGAVMRDRLEHIRSDAGPRPAGGESPEHHNWRAIQLLSKGPHRGGGGRFGPVGRLMRKVVLRLLRPFAAHQRQVDEAIVDSLLALARSTSEELTLQRAEILRQQRMLAAPREPFGIGHLRASLAAIEPIAQDAERLVSESRAEPYMYRSGFDVFDADGAGKVFGFRSGPGGLAADDAYVAFENVFRGPEELIAERQRVYLDLVADLAPVLDAGCGRGEFLDLLREAGIEAAGVDLDAGMVQRCRAKGHAAEVRDVNAHLKGTEAGTLGAIFCAQVVEHMPSAELDEFLSLSLSRLRPGGLLIAETVNPHSVAALKTFWVDPTHQHPIFPEAALQRLRAAGFSSAYVFHPNGTGDVTADRFAQGEYAVVARR
jgi:glycosyltransferase involved in cell wall biosynthesis/SAM-dependent methyltransferase